LDAHAMMILVRSLVLLYIYIYTHVHMYTASRVVRDRCCSGWTSSATRLARAPRKSWSKGFRHKFVSNKRTNRTQGLNFFVRLGSEALKPGASLAVVLLDQLPLVKHPVVLLIPRPVFRRLFASRRGRRCRLLWRSEHTLGIDHRSSARR
jgi:hypothetical protein